MIVFITFNVAASHLLKANSFSDWLGKSRKDVTETKGKKQEPLEEITTRTQSLDQATGLIVINLLQWTGQIFVALVYFYTTKVLTVFVVCF